MPDNQQSSQSPDAARGDLVSLEDAGAHLDTGPGASGGETIINAAEMFQDQLEQMTAWKQKLGQQMDMMRKDGIKLLERQKSLALEKARLTEERTNLTSQREQILNLRTEVESESQRLSTRAAELEQTQTRLAEFQADRERWEREIVVRQQGLSEREARALAEDVRLKEAFEQLEGQRRQLADAHRQAVADQEAAASQARDLASRTDALNQHDHQLQGRENEVRAAREHNEQAQAALRTHQEELAHREQTLAEKIKNTEAELQTRLAATQSAEQHLAEERQAVAKARQELQRRQEAIEQDHAEQLDALSKQTKRLSDRRIELENAEADLEKALSGRITEATESLKQELAENRDAHQQRISQLEQQIQSAQSAANEWHTHEQNLKNQLDTANATLEKLKDELQQAGASLNRVSAERSSLAQQLSDQIEHGKQEAAKWQQAIDAAREQSATQPSAGALEEANNELNTARKDISALKSRVSQLQAIKDDLEFQLEVRSEDAGKQLENLNAGLTQEIAKRDAEIADWKQKYQTLQNATPSSGGTAADRQKLEEMARQLETLEQQRKGLAAQLFDAQDTLLHHQQESLLAKNVLESKVIKLEQRNTTLEAEKSKWQAQRSKSSPNADPATLGQGRSQAPGNRERLLRQAKALRNFRMQLRDTRASLESGRGEIAQQREQLRSRKENLEQVKRLLEKQEMVMARKLADHNAIKTVAAIGIFVIMVLGSTFLGVYRFVHPIYRSETVVQLAVPPETQGPELDSWLTKQMQFVRSNENTFAAWKILRSSEEHYGMHDVREEWIASLTSNLAMQLDAGSKTLAIRYTGPDGEGVSQVCNALATAYITPNMREYSEASKNVGTGSQVVAKATIPLYPVEDNRMTISLATVGGVLVLSFLFVIIFRRFVMRQLKEIDQMADAEDLADMHTDLPDAGSAPAPAEA